MLWICLATALLSFTISVVLCDAVKRISLSRGLVDAAGTEAHKPAADTPIPNTGGVAVFWAVAFPLAAVMAAVWAIPIDTWAQWSPTLAVHIPGLRDSTAVGAWLLAGLAALHVTGLIDDRRALGAWPKLAVQLGVASVLATLGGMRVLSLLDGWGTAGSVLAVTLSVVWIVVVTNAMNFLDNMDGLAAGVGALAAALYLAATLMAGQWFVAGLCALLMGALLGFLIFNLPPARLYLGDGGSLVVGLLLAVIAIRTAYVYMGPEFIPNGGDWWVNRKDLWLSGSWYGLLMPFMVLAVPLYDFVSVVIIRLAKGQSPMTGDHNHFSHRLLRRGLSKRAALTVVLLATLATGLGGVMLSRVPGWMAAMLVAQAAAVIAMLALLEFSGER